MSVSSRSAALVSECGLTIELDVQRFFSPPSLRERRLLRTLRGSVLDVGCGPGRAAAYLRDGSTPALGLDISAGLVEVARSNGALCVHQSIFDPVPFEGRWQNILLLDGNIGIGGDPGKLLHRLAEIATPDARALVEVEAHGPTRQLVVREHRDGRIGEQFPWAVVSLAGLDDHLGAQSVAGPGWRCEHVHDLDGRLVVELGRTR